MWIAFHRFPAIFEVLVPQFSLGFNHRIIPKSLNSFCGWMSKSVLKLDADLLICTFSHCECDGHTVHKLSQQRLTTDLLAPWESDCSRTSSKVTSRPRNQFSRHSKWLGTFQTDLVFPIHDLANIKRHPKLEETTPICSTASYLSNLLFVRHLMLHGDITHDPRHGVCFLVLHSTVNKRNTT